jgi:hypothetical protein
MFIFTSGVITNVIKNRNGIGWDIGKSLRQIVAKLRWRYLPKINRRVYVNCATSLHTRSCRFAVDSSLRKI